MNRWEELARERLSDRRFLHVCGVVDTARELAVRYGVDREKCETAAWLHDILREAPASELRSLMADSGRPLPAGDAATWHGPVTAARLARDFGVHDDQIRLAIAQHTLGHPDMDKVSQVLFVADAIEPGRLFAGAERLRAAARMDLLLAVACVADASIQFLLDRRGSIAWQTVALRNRAWLGIDETVAMAYSENVKLIP
ncbi:MAG: bis(5'-nucleosyl)-tetraphosphatase (symmetrical) YqeK [Bacilli bacterium]